MKLTVLMLVVCLSQVVAATYAQTATLNVSAKNETLESVLKQIEKQSEFLFFYNLEEVNKNERLSLNKKNASIKDILDIISDRTGLKYTIKDRHIVLTSNEWNTKSAAGIAQQAQKVTGTVQDILGPIAGASVVVKGTTNGTVTDMDGNFVLENVKKGNTIQISFIGYITTELSFDGKTTNLTIQLKEDTQALDEVVE